MAPRILLVDDEYSSTEVLSLILRDEGYHVTVAANGRLALQRLADARPDLVITDFMMPGMNGADLVRAIRDLPDHRSTPVLMVSGAHPAALGFAGAPHERFLRKPFDLDAFLEAVTALLRREG